MTSPDTEALVKRARNELHTYERVGKQTASDLLIAVVSLQCQLAEALEERDELTKHVAFLRDALGKEHKSVWRDAKLSASTEEAVEAILEWSADSARVSALSAEVERLKAGLAEIGNGCEGRVDKDSLPCRIARASLNGGSDHG